MAIFRALLILVFAGPAVLADRVSLTFATDWKAQAEHGGFYQALATGAYGDAGLDVRIRPGGPQSDVPRLLAAGAVDIALISNAFQPFNLASAGADVVVVMASFQKDPQVLMVHGDDRADGFADLKDRPIFVADSALATFWPWLRVRFGYSDSQIRKYTYSLAPWLVNPGSVQEGYLTSEPYSARQAGKAPKVFLFADAGYQGYAAMVGVRRAFLQQKPEAVRSFVNASVTGWRDFLGGDPAPANTLILKDNPEMTEDLIAFSRDEMVARSIVGPSETTGCMSLARWSAFQEEMSALGIVSGDIDVEAIISLDFLPHCQP